MEVRTTQPGVLYTGESSQARSALSGDPALPRFPEQARLPLGHPPTRGNLQEHDLVRVFGPVVRR